MQSDQRRRARGIDDKAWAGKIETIRDAVGDQRQGASGHVIRIAARGIEYAPGAMVDGRGADINADRCAREPGRGYARVFKRLPNEFEQQALLRVDLYRFARVTIDTRFVADEMKAPRVSVGPPFGKESV